MPNRVFLVFDVERRSPIGWPYFFEKNESDYEIVAAVAKKLYGQSPECEGTLDDWQDVIADTLPQSCRSNASIRAILETYSNENITSEDHLPCITIVDVAVALREHDEKIRNEWVKSIKLYALRILNASRGTQRLEFVCTCREWQLDPAIRDQFAGITRRFVPLARNDSNAWDELANIIKCMENSIRTSEIMQQATGVDQTKRTFEANEPYHPRACRCLSIKRGDNGLTVRATARQLADAPKILFFKQQIDLLEIVGEADRSEFAEELAIVDCQVNQIKLINLAFKKGVIFRNSRIRGVCEIRNCDFQSYFDVRTCAFKEDFFIEYCQFQNRTPWFRKVDFNRRLEFRRSISPESTLVTPTLMFHRCDFKSRTRIDMPEQRLRLTFYNCRFTENEYTEVNWNRYRGDMDGPVIGDQSFTVINNKRHRREDIRNMFYKTWHHHVGEKEVNSKDHREEFKLHGSPESVYASWRRTRRFTDLRTNDDTCIADDIDIYVRLTSCSINGPIVFRENPHYDEGFPYLSRAGLTISLEGSSIGSHIDVSRCRLRAVHAARAKFTGGSLGVNNFEYRPRTPEPALLPRSALDLFRDGLPWLIGVWTLLLGGLAALFTLQPNLLNHPPVRNGSLFVLEMLAIQGDRFEFVTALSRLLLGLSTFFLFYPRKGWWRRSRKGDVLYALLLITLTAPCIYRYLRLAVDYSYDHIGFEAWNFLLALFAVVIWQLRQKINRDWSVEITKMPPDKRILTLEKKDAVKETDPFKGIQRRVRDVLRVRGEYLGLVSDEKVLFSRDLFRFTDAMRMRAEIESFQPNPGKVTGEQKAVWRKGMLLSLSDQYGELEQAFNRTSNSDVYEDFCHYKSLHYRNEALATDMSLQRRLFATVCLCSYLFIATFLCGHMFTPFGSWSLFLASAIPSIFVTRFSFGLPSAGENSRLRWILLFGLLIDFPFGIYFWIWPADDSMPYGMALLVATGLITLALLVFSRENRRFVKYLFVKHVLGELLGYGAYPGRVIVSSFAIVVVFATIYWVVLCGSELALPWTPGSLGDVGATVDLLPEEHGTSKAFFQCLYFSSVTFTTLGYGEIAPKGGLRVVAMFEVFIGCIMIAVLTTALARQFLRR